MQNYGAFDAKGMSGNQSARIALRAPRVAIRVDISDNWQSRFALAMASASRLWGGFGFIYIPVNGRELHPALARVLAAYDPDYLVDALWLRDETIAVGPGWPDLSHESRPLDPGAPGTMTFAQGTVLRSFESGDIGGNLCSPFYDREEGRKLRTGGHTSFRAVRDLTSLIGMHQATFEVPSGLDAHLTLALGLRAGYPHQPTLPLIVEANDGAECLPHRYIDYVLQMRQKPAALGFPDLTTAWSLTATGLVPIAEFGPRTGPVAVIGSTAEDFALAVALHRMYGKTIWIPEEWTQNRRLQESMQRACRNLLQRAMGGTPPIVTSISLSAEQAKAAVQASWPKAIQAQCGDNKQEPDSDSVDVVQAEHLDLGSPAYLACIGDYDISFTSPTRADGYGGSEFLFPIPPYSPSSEMLRGAEHPFWVVDVKVYPRHMPAGRDLGAKAILADDERIADTMLRIGRDGVSISSWAGTPFVPFGATLAQAAAMPTLRVLGLRGWIEALVSQDQPDIKVQLSQAGRRAMVLTRLWGSRALVASDLLQLNNFLREFKPNGRSDTEAYDNGDGVRLASAEGCLTFAAAVRTLPGVETRDIRDRLNYLLRRNILQRGLIVRCSECERRAFYRIDVVGERNVCSRCGASAYTAAAWQSERGDPEWFYDLHGAVRELLEQNGDVPFLAGWRLAANALSFEDIAELDFCRPDEKPDEIDVAAVVDGQLVIGEAKCVSTLGTAKEVHKAIEKLLRVGDLLGTDEILLATTAPGPWNPSETRRLATAVARHQWRFGKKPMVRVLTNLRDNPQTELLGDGRSMSEPYRRTGAPLVKSVEAEY